MGVSLKTIVDPSDYELGVLVARFQIDRLHTGHKALIDSVVANHKKVIVFLGIPAKDKGGTRRNPLPYAAREKMVKAEYPDVVVMPIQDKRSNQDWSNQLDSLVKQPYGNQKCLMYGARDSFLKHYCGKNDTTELTSDIYYSSTAVRKEISSKIPASEEWRAGAIHAVYDRYPVTYPTVDIIPYNKDGQVLLAQRANSNQWRMIGGFVDREDVSWEAAAGRELAEEAGSWEHGKLEYVTSGQVKDWRYRGDEDGIMTTVFKCEHLFGRPVPDDDIYALSWKSIDDLCNYDTIVANIVSEHVEFVIKVIESFGREIVRTAK
tara:strand:- start:10925 stop:11884 length:960 start_codon:yes stop_codon:yes gene_type:complete